MEKVTPGRILRYSSSLLFLAKANIGRVILRKSHILGAAA